MQCNLANTPDSIESDENSDSQKCYQCKINICEDGDSCNWLVCFRCPNWICGSCLDDIYPNFNRLDEFYFVITLITSGFKVSLILLRTRLHIFK